MKVEGCEWCPYCEYENDFEVDENTSVGKVVYWHDPDNGVCSGYYKVNGFENDIYIIYILGSLTDEGDEIEAYYDELEFLNDDEKNKILKELDK